MLIVVYNAFPRMRFYTREHYILTENQTIFSEFSPTFVLATALPGSPNYYTPVYKGCGWGF